LALLIPFVALELVQNKNLRYSLPLLPLLAVLAGLGFAALPRRGRLGVTVIAIIVGAMQLGGTLAGGPATSIPGLGVPFVLASPPRAQDWRQREILEVIARDRAATGAAAVPPRISVVPNHAYFSVSNFRYYALRDDRPMAFSRAWDEEPLGVDYMIL